MRPEVPCAAAGTAAVCLETTVNWRAAIRDGVGSHERKHQAASSQSCRTINSEKLFTQQL